MSGRDRGDESDPTDGPKLPETLEPARYYDEYGHEEWERLEATLGGHLEFDGTTAALERFLPDAGRILDVGGGAGRYAVWLAERGYEVTLVDVSGRQCAIAREKVTEHDLEEQVSVVRGDLRSMPITSESFDAVCCTGGPLSHVVDAAEREAAIGELHRVARPGAPVFVSVMSRLAVLQNLVQNPKYSSGMRELAAHGSYTRAFVRTHLDHLEEPGFTACHFFRAGELEAALTDAGFDVEELIGLEGIATNVGERLELADLEPEAVEKITAAVRELRTDPAVVDWSNHILAVARR